MALLAESMQFDTDDVIPKQVRQKLTRTADWRLSLSDPRLRMAARAVRMADGLKK